MFEKILNETESRTILITETDGTVTNGQVNIVRGRKFDRLSDLINNTDEMFLVVFDASVTELGAEESYTTPVVFINKRHIKRARPDDTQK